MYMLKYPTSVQQLKNNTTGKIIIVMNNVINNKQQTKLCSTDLALIIWKLIDQNQIFQSMTQ